MLQGHVATRTCAKQFSRVTNAKVIFVIFANVTGLPRYEESDNLRQRDTSTSSERKWHIGRLRWEEILASSGARSVTLRKY